MSEKPLLYAIGSFDKRVTVLSQQTRALNLAWSLIETQVIPTGEYDRRPRVAVIGAGFAGLTFVAALLKKEAACDIILFERFDTLLPLQQGSDTRWLHPHIYDWPADGSEVNAAMLPILNWTAARSSDVVVQVLGEWAQIVRGNETVRLFCNTRHLQITRCRDHVEKARVEWVGEARNPGDGTFKEAGGSARGSSETFDVTVMACGFGLEKGNAIYWRNETLGQPSLNEPRRTYLLSGQGDGAMIDLLRIRVSQFRQDRILEELFGSRPDLVAELRRLNDEFLAGSAGLFDRFEMLAAPGSPHRSGMEGVSNELSRRLRRDTDVVLGLLVRNVSELLEPTNGRMSFQNALLVFLLYRCGGFAPSTEGQRTLRQRFSIPEDLIVERHGVQPLEQLKHVLSEDILEGIEKDISAGKARYKAQTAACLWPGGYFGYPGRTADTDDVRDDGRRRWRKEYLPGPTALVATVICGAVQGVIERLRPHAGHYRLTLHRTLTINGEELLQQACDYSGRGLENASATAGRTFPIDAATIGAAHRCRRIVRSPRNVNQPTLILDMGRLRLHVAARTMLPDVGFVLAMPILEPERCYYPPSPVAAVLYLDSRDPGFWLDDTEIRELGIIVQAAVRSLEAPFRASLGRVRNQPLKRAFAGPSEKPAVSTESTALEIVHGIDPPSSAGAFVLNFDFTDLAPVTTDSTTFGP